jgi:hypothetical protein
MASLQTDWNAWKELGVLTEGEDSLHELTAVFLGATAFFFFVFYFSKYVFGPTLKAFGCTAFGEMSKRTQAEYHSRNVSDVHAIIALPLALYSCFGVCDDHTKTVFDSDECLMKPQKLQLYLICISTGYCVYDLVICMYEIGYKFSEGADFIFHHVVGILGALAVMIAGKYTVALSAGNLVSEFSNWAMNLRWRLLKHKMTEHWAYLPVNALFMMAYIFSRIFFMLALLVRNYQVQQVYSLSTHPD